MTGVRLQGKVALVTGGGGAIGGAIAQALAAEGARVVVADVSVDGGRQVAADIGGLFLRLDVTDRRSVEEAVGNVVGTFGGIDVLVNCAGLNTRVRFLDLTEADLDLVLNVNLKGTFLVSQAVARRMVERRQGGHIVNIELLSSRRPRRDLTHYQAAKAGVTALPQGTRLELPPHGICVNGIAPGLIETPLTAGNLADPAVRRERLGRIPLGRIGRPEDLVPVVLLLASDESSWMTGTVIVVDGGQLVA